MAEIECLPPVMKITLLVRAGISFAGLKVLLAIIGRCGLFWT